MSVKGTVTCRTCKIVHPDNEPVWLSEAIAHLKHRITDIGVNPLTGFDRACYRAVVAALDNEG